MTEQLDLEDRLSDHPKTLTEQWKKGELELGREYWLKTAFTRLPEKGFFTKIEGELGFYRKPKGFRKNNLLDVEKVLAPVPSYEEWQKVLNIDFNNEVLRLENAKLKELLWACQDELYSHLDSGAEAMADAITKTIGEKK